MNFYRQTKLFQALISAAQNPQFCADPAIQASYNKQRFSQAMRALRSRNVFLYTEGARTGLGLGNVNTIYTQPAGERMLLLGYSDNFRYGAVTTQTIAGPNPAALLLPQTHRVRIVGNQERVLVDDFVPAQAGVSGQPRYTDTRLVSPTIIEANEQIAVDLGYDTAAAAAAVLPPQAFIFFCVKVKDKLTPDDQAVAAEIQSFINANCFQLPVYFNCANPQANDTGAGNLGGNALTTARLGINSTSVAGAIFNANTPPTGRPVLITAIGTNLEASTIIIIDSSDGHSFSLNRPMQSSALNLPMYENDAGVAITAGAPVVGPCWTSYFQLPVPHLLRRGAQLNARIVVGGDAGAGPGTITEWANFYQLIFQGLTV